MLAVPLFLALFIFATILWWPCSPVYYKGTHLRQQGKLHLLSRELVQDTEMKIMAVQRYRDQYYKSLQYQLGDIVFELRNFFKKMVVLYQATHRNVSYDYLNHNENIRTMVQIYRMATEIENKVVMVQTWQNKRETKPEHHKRMKAVPRSGPNRLYDDVDEPLREVMVRERMARGPGARAGLLVHGPKAHVPDPGSKRNNKKWRHVSDRDFE